MERLLAAIRTRIIAIFDTVFRTEFFGRLSRKFFHVSVKLAKTLHRTIENWNAHLPYLHKLGEVLYLDKTRKYYRTLQGYLQTLPRKPLISILIPVYKTNHHYLRECLESCCAQIYQNWEICIVDDCSKDPGLLQIIEEFAKQYPGRIKYAENRKNCHISETLNSCLELASGDFIALVDHDDRIYPNALAEFVRYHNLYSNSDIFYSDERVIGADGEKLATPFHKPNWSPIFHLAANYTTHLSFYRTSLAREIKGFVKGLEGSQDHDFMLRAVENTKSAVIHIPFCLYQWRAHPESTASSIDAKPYAAIAGENAVKAHLARRGREATVTYDPATFHYRIVFALPETLPLVSLIIPSKDHVEILKHCLDSVLAKTTYPNYEIVISDNGSTTADCASYYQELKLQLGERLTIVKDTFPFNFGRQINAGAKVARGEYLILLNNDTELLTPDWIQEFLQWGQFPEIGAVGCKLLYPEDRLIQHGGIVLSAQHIAEHEGLLLRENDRAYCDMLNTVREVEAVTAACLFIAKAKFHQVGGFDQVFLPNVYGDVEFCLNLRRAGFTNVYNPHAVLKHFESKTRGQTIEEFERFYMLAKFGKELATDSYHNPRLATAGGKPIDPMYLFTDVSNANFKTLVTEFKLPSE